MIDDDFDKMIRRMFEQLFQTTGMFGPIRNNQIRIQNPRNERAVRDDTNAPRVETIELEDRLIVMIDNLQGITIPIATITGRELSVALAESQEDILIELPFAVDIDKSSILSHNGIVEINLIKSTDIENSSDMAERTLKNEFRD
ncbi:MAG: hypothetical protein ACTSV2_02460 [Candidatus Thorarchaeota archaeon]